MSKHVYRNSADWYVAESAEDAKRLSIELGYEEDENDPFEQEPDDKMLAINEDDGSGGRVTKTCAEWSNESDVGFLCSTEY